MPGLKLMCPICTEEFEESEEIYSTSCGHIYHLNCMRQWHSRESSCPQCRQPNPSCYKLYLILNDVNEETPSAPVDDHEDLTTKLESSVDKILELQAQVQQSELNFMHLQGQYTVEQELRKQFEHRVAEFNENDENCLHFHAQYSKFEGRTKLLQEEIRRLTMENKYKSEELVLQASEISALKESLSTMLKLNTQLVYSERQFLHLHAQFSESENRLKILQEENKRTVMGKEYKSKELELQNNAFSASNGFQNTKNIDSSEFIKNTKVITLDQKLKQVTSDLEKEIANISLR